MWTHKYNLVARTGSYVAKDQTTKFSWETVGKVIENDSGKKMIMIKRSFNPAGVLQEPGKNGQISDHIVLTMSEVKSDEQEEDRSAKRPSKEFKPVQDDDLLF